MHDERLLETSPGLHALRTAFERESGSAPWPRAAAADSAATLARAELDLLGVHHVEIARILSRAVTWLERRAEDRRLAAFQARAAGAVAAARAAGAYVPSAAVRVAHARPAEWPTKELLARSAFELDPCADHEALLERVQPRAEE